MDQRNNGDCKQRDISNGVNSDGQLSGRVADTESENQPKTVEAMTANYTPKRGNEKIEAIVLHRTEGTIQSALDWLKRPESKASYHVLVDETGKVYEMVPDHFTAWHAGAVINPSWRKAKVRKNVNEYTIGIGISGKADEPMTLQQLLAVALLIKEKCEAHKIELDKNNIIPHYMIRSDKICPGPMVNIPALVYVAKHC